MTPNKQRRYNGDLSQSSPLVPLDGMYAVKILKSPLLSKVAAFFRPGIIGKNKSHIG